MGFLSKVGKGIKKAFKKVGKFVGKLASSKFGKILLIAAAVFTLGTALIAGVGAFASTAGTFAAKFVAAGKAFVGALASPLKTAKGLFNGAKVTGATANAASTTAQVAEAVGATAPASTPVGVLAGEGVAASTGAAAAGGGVAAAAPNLAPLAAPALAAPAAPGISLASQVGSAAANVGSKVANFATSAQGLTLAGNAAQGFAAGKAQEEVLKEQRREREFYDNQYRDPAKIAQLNAAAARPVNLSGGFIDRARKVAEFMNGRPGSGTSAQPGNPDDTYGRYVVGY